mmetsp:Transcript_30864/g.30361  ORF Transcript_30864/g.30361 Transcript_30864/m.30361 type:complete len:108 (-) Transcript_30864:835-1158(-)
MDGIDREQIKLSLSPEANRERAFKAGESQGKSGSFFFFSHDSQFIIKTMTESELQYFLSILEDFYYHLAGNPDSMLARIYGVYTVKMEDVVPVHIILMANTIQLSKP